MSKRTPRRCRSLVIPVSVSLLALAAGASCQVRKFNASGTKSASLTLSQDTFRGVLFQVKPMLIWATYDYANSALQWVLSKQDFQSFQAEEWIAKPYGSNRFDFLIQPRGDISKAYTGTDFVTDVRALAVALEANFRYAPGDVKLDDGSVIKGKAATKVEIMLKDGLDHSQRNFVTGMTMPWDSSLKVGTDDPEWARNFVRVPEAWVHLKMLNKEPGEGVTIGVIDTGLLPHPVVWGGAQMPPQLDLSKAATFESTSVPLSQRIKSAFGPAWKDEAWTKFPPLAPDVFKAVDVYSFNAAPANPGHGTAVVSILAGVGKGTIVESDNPKTYVQGIVPASRIVPVRVGPSTVVLDAEPMTKAFSHLTKQKVDVITVSLGGVPDVELHEAIIEAYKKGIIVTAAAGNGLPFVVWPAAYKEVIAVGAGDIQCKPWSKSSPGTKVEILAPGDEVWYAASFFDKRLYGQKGTGPASDAIVYAVKRGQGTSFATPHVASAAALWLSKFGAENIKAHYRSQKGKYSDDRYVSLAFRYLMARPGGHTLCKGGTAARDRRDAGGAYLNMLGLLNMELSAFPSKAQLDDFEVGGLREQESYDLALTALATVATGLPDVFTREDNHDDDISLLPEGVRGQLISIFKEKVADVRAALKQGR